MRSGWVNFGLLILSITLSLVLLETVSRLVYPISVGPKFITANGLELPSWSEPGQSYRQVSSEYNAVTNITSKGHRAPEVRENPEVIFIGDSYTFGVGLSDEETFPFRYGLSMGISIANLASPGLGTEQEIDRLELALTDWRWQPRSVMLFIFAMTTSYAGGNDIVDNLEYRNIPDSSKLAGTGSKQKDTLRSRIYKYFKGEILHASNIARILKFHLGSQVRSIVTLQIDHRNLQQSLELTRHQFLRLQMLGQKYDFICELFLIHPIQDIIRGTADHTYRTLQSISPFPIFDTAQLFSVDPETFYYAYDGHLNANGSASIAQFLISREKKNGISQPFSKRI